jgi:hypothetical protein
VIGESLGRLSECMFCSGSIENEVVGSWVEHYCMSWAAADVEILALTALSESMTSLLK